MPWANAQTGNMVLVALETAEGRWGDALAHLIPILAFAAGVLVAEAVKTLHCRPGRLHWRHTVLLVEILTLLAAALVPQGRWDGAVNVAVSFVCALQVEAFRKVRGYPFASTMCTGNLRSGTEALYHGAVRGQREQLRRSGYYFAVILCFMAGAALGGAVSPRLPQWALGVPAGLQGAAFLLMCRRNLGKSAKNR